MLSVAIPPTMPSTGLAVAVCWSSTITSRVALRSSTSPSLSASSLLSLRSACPALPPLGLPGPRLELVVEGNVTSCDMGSGCGSCQCEGLCYGDIVEACDLQWIVH